MFEVSSRESAGYLLNPAGKITFMSSVRKKLKTRIASAD
jgi:hypothetical protein